MEIAFNCLSVERNVLACSCSATSPPSLTDPVLSTTRPTPPRQTTSKDTAGRGWRRQAPLCLPRPVRLRHACQHSTGRGWVRNRYVTHWPSDEHVFSKVRQNASREAEFSKSRLKKSVRSRCCFQLFFVFATRGQTPSSGRLHTGWENTSFVP